MVLLFFGLSGSGKTTLAESLHKIDKEFFLLDGDILREGLCSDLGFSPEDRSENLRRSIHCARLLSLAGKKVIVSMIAPYQEDRLMAQEICSDVEYLDVFIDCPLEVCEKRDVKGLYKKAREGSILNFTGVSDPFEIPINPTYRLRTNLINSPEVLVHKMIVALNNKEHLYNKTCVL